MTLPAPNSAIPERLEGWGLAAGAGICALMLLWPPRQRADFQRQAAGALRAVADLLDADRESWGERMRVARASVDALGQRLLGAQHRPTGPTGPMAALASLPDELDWLLSFLTPSPEAGLEPAQRTPKRWRPRQGFFMRLPRDSRAATDGPISSGWKRRAMPSHARS